MLALLGHAIIFLYKVLTVKVKRGKMVDGKKYHLFERMIFK